MMVDPIVKMPCLRPLDAGSALEPPRIDAPPFALLVDLPSDCQGDFDGFPDIGRARMLWIGNATTYTDSILRPWGWEGGILSRDNILHPGD